MQGTHLVGMVREVGVRAGIVKRELATNQQRTLMVGSRERAAESSTGLTIGHITVGEEHAGLCRKAVGNLASLAHEAVLHLHRVGDAATVRDDAVLADNTCADVYGSIF